VRRCEFALGGVPVDAVISSATLALSIPVTPPALNTAELHGYTGDGVITAADLTLNNLLTTFQVSAAGSVVIPIDTSFIQDLLIANEIFAGFALRNVTDPSGVFTFYTVDSGFEQFNPILTIELDGLQAVPEPGSMVLLGTALAACGGRAWRRLAH
jgi:PEP-CTERM motif